MSDFDRDRLRQKIVEVGALLLQAAQTGRTLNEADTEYILVDPFLHALGYGPLEIKKRSHDTLTRTFPDYTVLDGTPHRWFLEVKQLDLPLHDREAAQAVTYAINQGAAWAILTNGRAWYFYLAHLQKPLDEKRVFQIDDVFADSARSADVLGLLSRASMSSDGLTRTWNAQQTQAKIVALVRRELTTPASSTRKTLRKVAALETGAAVTDSDIGSVLQTLLSGAASDPPANEPTPVLPPSVPPPSPQTAPAPITPALPSDLPSGDWKTLDELRRDTSLTTGRKPTRVLLGGTDVQAVKSWSEVAKFVVQFLGDHYPLPPLPYSLTDNGEYYLNTQPLRVNGQPMFNKAMVVVSGQNVFINTNRNSAQTVSGLSTLFMAVSAPPDAVRVEISPLNENQHD